MKTVSISGSPRENVGKKDASHLRRSGLVPCVLYGGKEQIHFAADATEFKDLIYTPNVSIAKLNIAGKEYEAILQDAQYHVINDKLMHVDFLLVESDKPVKINIPVNLIGTAEGVRGGGKLEKKSRLLKVKGLSKDLPDTIDVNVEHLNVGQIIRVKDITLNNVTILETPTNVIATVKGKRGMEAAAPEAAAKPTAAAKPAAAPAAAPAKKK